MPAFFCTEQSWVSELGSHQQHQEKLLLPFFSLPYHHKVGLDFLELFFMWFVALVWCLWYSSLLPISLQPIPFFNTVTIIIVVSWYSKNKKYISWCVYVCAPCGCEGMVGMHTKVFLLVLWTHEQFASGTIFLVGIYLLFSDAKEKVDLNKLFLGSDNAHYYLLQLKKCSFSLKILCGGKLRNFSVS